METKFNTIEEVLEDLRQGKIVVMMDDEDRENEGDVICAAEFATLENVNFMASYAKGLICMPMSEEYTNKLNLPQMCAEIQTIIVRHLQYPLITRILLQVFLLMSGGSRQEWWQTTMQSHRIFVVRAICSHFWQRRAVCWSVTDIRRQPWIFADWQA